MPAVEILTKWPFLVQLVKLYYFVLLSELKGVTLLLLSYTLQQYPECQKLPANVGRAWVSIVDWSRFLSHPIFFFPFIPSLSSPASPAPTSPAPRSHLALGRSKRLKMAPPAPRSVLSPRGRFLPCQCGAPPARALYLCLLP